MNYTWEITSEAQLHFDFWSNSNNKSILRKIEKLVKEIDNSPRIGIGKPELLKRDLSGYWSRRINSEHRFVYHIDDKDMIITIVSLRFHY